MRSGWIVHRLLHLKARARSSPPFSTFRRTVSSPSFLAHKTDDNNNHNHKTLLKPSFSFSQKQPTSLLFSRLLNAASADGNPRKKNPVQYEVSDQGDTDGWGEDDGWEEEEEVDPKIGDGGDGGGIVLQGVPWGEHALSIANEVLLQFDDDVKLYAFKTTPRGYVYIRLDKLSAEYGCPSIEELESYCQQYKRRLEEVGALGEIPDDLAVEVSSPGAERILKVPDDLCRFKGRPMRVCYSEDMESNCHEKNGVFFLDSIETESENCVWKLADVKENRDPQSKGRPLSRKMRDWRLKLPFQMHRMVSSFEFIFPTITRNAVLRMCMRPVCDALGSLSSSISGVYLASISFHGVNLTKCALTLGLDSGTLTWVRCAQAHSTWRQKNLV